MSRPKKSFWRNNGLSITLLGLFLLCWAGQSVVGAHAYNDQREDQGQPPLSFSEYLRSPHFLEATTENWESEFLQMGFYVVLTVFLYQKGSSESKTLDGENPQDEDPRKHRNRPGAPWPVRSGGWILKLYESSLALAFLGLFLFSICFHAIGGARLYSEEQVAHGKAAVSTAEYLCTSQFWFESLQNWQSEFLAILSMVVLSIWLRQRGSPESKPVAAPHSSTGDAE